MKGMGEVYVPMATIEGCLVANTNRGCKAIYASGGVDVVCMKEGMSRAPVVRLPSARRAAELKFCELPIWERESRASCVWVYHAAAAASFSPLVSHLCPLSPLPLRLHSTLPPPLPLPIRARSGPGLVFGGQARYPARPGNIIGPGPGRVLAGRARPTQCPPLLMINLKLIGWNQYIFIPRPWSSLCD
ncbi:3-hydroxy-3-methylglutaryl-coenzyme A reductase 1 [Nymphaea thermarum]|nr:3-hydroxy-3-methylglutaryl-coenzyme A reductase 1 [Nymphaea thermarum]